MRSLKASRIAPRHAAIGALALGSTLSVAAIALAAPAPAPAEPLALRAPALPKERVAVGERVEVRGRVAPAAAGRRLALELAPAARRWRVVETAVVARDGSYRFEVRPRRSGRLRVVALPERQGAGGAEALAAEAPARSRSRRLTVAAKVLVERRGRDAGVGEAVRVSGALIPRSRGRTVLVEGARDGRWHRVAVARTKKDGRFSAPVVARRLGTQKLRVRFAGDRRNAGSRAPAGTLQGFRPGLASWYWLYGGPLACGGRLGYHQLGVAHKTLPCGTKVTFRYRGREVTVPVIDRGPYVGGREWDLTGATARRLGFSGVGVVWSTV